MKSFEESITETQEWFDKEEEKPARVIFAPVHDRRGRSILSVRDQNTFANRCARSA